MARSVNEIIEKLDENSRKLVEEFIAEKVRENEEFKKELLTLNKVISGTKHVLYKYSSKSGGIFRTKNVYKVLGIRSNDLKKNPMLWNNSIHPEEKNKINAELKKLKKGDIREFEYRFIKPSGKTIWLRDKFICTQKTNTETIVEGIATDITRLKEAELIAKEKSLDYRSVFENAAEGIAIGNTNGKIISVNNNLRKLTSYNEKDLIGKGIEILFPPSQLKEKPLQYKDIYDGKLISNERLIKTKTGKLIPVEMKSKSLPDGRLISFISDISERKKKEKENKESEAKFRTIFEEDKTIKLLIDPADGRIINANEAAARFYKYRLEKLRKMNIKQINVLSEDEIQNEMNKAAKKSKNYFEFKHKTSKGEIKDVEVHSTPIRIDKKEYLISLIHDITDRLKAEKAVAESEKTYRALIDDVIVSSSIATFILDADFRVIWINDATEKFFSIKKKNVVGKDKRNLINKHISKLFEDPDAFRKKIFKTYNNNTFIESFEINIPAKGQRKERWLQHWSQPIRKGLYAGGRIEHYTDITKRKKSEIALMESEKRFRIMADTAPVMIWMSDESKLCTYFNKPWLEFTGRTFEQELGNGWSSGVHPDDLTYVIDTYNTNFDLRQPFEMRYRLKFNDGNYRWVYDHGVPRFNNEGYFIGYIGSCIDVNDQKIAEESLSLHSKIIDNMAEGASLVDSTTGEILFANPSFEKMFNYEPGELIGENISIINAPTGNSPEEVAEEIQYKLRNEGSWTGELLNKTKDGQNIWTYAVVSTFKHEELGDVWVAAQSDISAKKEAELYKDKEKQRLQILHDLYTKTGDMSYEELYNYVIDKAEKLTDSKVSFFHKVSEDQKTVILTTWSSSTLKNCRVDYDSHYPLSQAGNWVDCVRKMKPVVYNDFEQSPNQKGLPEGHLKLFRFMSVPVVNQGKVNYIFGVGNKETDYTENDVLQLQIIADELNRIIEKRRTNEELVKSNTVLREAERIGKIGFYSFEVPEGEVKWSDETFKLVDLEDLDKPLSVEDYYKIIHPDDLAFTKSKIENAILNKTSFDFVYRIITSKNNLKFLQSVGSVVLNESNEVIAVSGIIKDITDYQKALIEVQENEEKFEKAFKTSPDAMAITKLKDGVYLDINDSFKRIIGYEREELIGKSSIEMNIWRYEKDREKLTNGLKENGYVENMDAEFLRKNGEVIYGLMSARTIKFGNEIVVLSITRDISERKRMQKMLEESELKHRSLISNISDVIVIINKEGIIEYKSPNIKNHFGWEPEDLIGKHSLVTIHPDDYERIAGELQLLLENKKKKVTIEFNYKCKDGYYKPVELTAVNLLNDPVIKGIAANYKDISDRRKAEKAVIETQRLGAIGEMSSAIAHDFNNSLQSIFGNLELALLQTDEDSPIKRYLDIIKTATSDAAHRVRLLQRFAGTSKYQNEYIAVDVKELMEDVIIQSRPLWKDKSEKNGITIKIELDFKEDVRVKGNGAEIKSVFYNIIKNSVEAMPNGGTITVSAKTDSEQLSIKFIDDGVGMDDETRSRLFQPFFTTKGFESGRGLGMSGAYSIIKEHGGDIFVEYSDPGKGTVIEIYLPVSDVCVPIEKESSKLITKNKLKILVVDDDNEVRSIVKELLEAIGQEADVAENGLKALELIKENQYNFIITDIGMPDMNGWELSKRINEQTGNNIPLAVLSGWGGEISEEELSEYGISYLLEKPIVINKLQSVIEEVLKTTNNN